MSVQNQGVDAGGLMAAAGALSAPSEDYGNDSRVEALWAMKAMEHAEVYFNILCSVDPKQIPRLSSCDDAIYEKFRADFPSLKVDKLSEEDLKSEEAKPRWRAFCEHFKDTVDDYSFATLLRLDANDEYSEANSIVATKVQFYAVEVARNREGHNDGVRLKFKPRPRRHRPPPGATEGKAQPMMADVERELQQILSGHHMLQQ